MAYQDPVDTYLGTFRRDDQASDHKTYAARLRERLEYAYRSAAAEASRQSTKSEAAYNLRVRDSRLEVGDTVLVRNVGLQGKYKLADRWDSNPYVVLEMPNADIPVYKVRRRDKVGPVRCLQRNLLLPFNSVPLETTGEVRKDPPPPHVLAEGSNPHSHPSLNRSRLSLMFPGMLYHKDESAARTPVRLKPTAHL